VIVSAVTAVTAASVTPASAVTAVTPAATVATTSASAVATTSASASAVAHVSSVSAVTIPRPRDQDPLLGYPHHGPGSAMAPAKDLAGLLLPMRGLATVSR
jgi:hypothetical protein